MDEDRRTYDYFDKYTFLCEMYDSEVDDIKELVLNFFPFDNSVQIIDVEKGKAMIRRVQIKGVDKRNLHIGNMVNIFSKLLLLKDCAPLTRKTLFNNVKSTFAMIKPISPALHGKVLTFIMKKGFRILQMKNAKLGLDLARNMYRHLSGVKEMPIIIDYITSGEVIGLELEAEDAINKWRACLGATDPKYAAPGTLRKLLGEDMLRNVAHGSETEETVKEMLHNFFGYENGIPILPYRATLKDCTCCIIKPHVLLDGNVGSIVEHIATSKNLYISAQGMFTFDINDAREFYEIYSGVVPEYEAMCIELTEGRFIAMELKSKDPNVNVVCEFRKLCGPRDPDLGRQLYPESIRALYGKTTVQNAVHCTDLPEDGELEVEYFFKLIALK
ncbi:nucleoside diphosphate kinase 7-like [Hyposmocoma kahamanoa]|uniref:nucleoside diphosphate kinase 7-like n=1 Tax=Hyposmocoma kahamanoa TaxID=1477025 RepID=UPI000E6D6AE1|nr:nucleoside diphosphate kinase 7-like [Hyposmocoma kahamanoa]